MKGHEIPRGSPAVQGLKSPVLFIIKVKFTQIRSEHVPAPVLQQAKAIKW
jgi:hypothetical protein